QLADFVKRNSPLVPVILDTATGTTRQLTLFYVQCQRQAAVAWDSSFYLATVTRLGYMQTDDAAAHGPRTVSVLPEDSFNSEQCVVHRIEQEGPVLYVDVVDRETAWRDKSKCATCGVAHQAMCA